MISRDYVAVYKKENMLQCRFYNGFVDTDYIGKEFPIGQHLITAISYTREEVVKIYQKAIASILNYLDNKSAKNLKLYKNCLLNVDDYCVYFHKVTYKLLSLITFTHLQHYKTLMTDFVDSLSEEDSKMITEQLKICKKNKTTNEYISLWTLVINLLLNDFDKEVSQIKLDIFNICNANNHKQGLSRLLDLDKKRYNFYFNLEFPMFMGLDLGVTEDSNFFLSALSNEDIVTRAVNVSTTLDLMHYDFTCIFENNMPLKICKNCNTPFIPKGRADSLYCDRIMPGFKYKCLAIGALNTHKSKQPEIENEFFTARKRYATRARRKPHLIAEFDVWKLQAKEKLTEYRSGKISADEFRKWFMDDEWTKIKK